MLNLITVLEVKSTLDLLLQKSKQRWTYCFKSQSNVQPNNCFRSEINVGPTVSEDKTTLNLLFQKSKQGWACWFLFCFVSLLLFLFFPCKSKYCWAWLSQSKSLSQEKSICHRVRWIRPTCCNVFVTMKRCVIRQKLRNLTEINQQAICKVMLCNLFVRLTSKLFPTCYWVIICKYFCQINQQAISNVMLSNKL